MKVKARLQDEIVTSITHASREGNVPPSYVSVAGTVEFRITLCTKHDDLLQRTKIGYAAASETPGPLRSGKALPRHFQLVWCIPMGSLD